jgi:hypothetical protein
MDLYHVSSLTIGLYCSELGLAPIARSPSPSPPQVLVQSSSPLLPRPPARRPLRHLLPVVRSIPLRRALKIIALLEEGEAITHQEVVAAAIITLRTGVTIHPAEVAAMEAISPPTTPPVTSRPVFHPSSASRPLPQALASVSSPLCTTVGSRFWPSLAAQLLI